MRRIILPLAAVLLLAVALYAAYWLYAAERLRHEVTAWAAAEQAAGTELRWRRETLGGFPFAFRLRFDDPSLTLRRAPGYRLSSTRLILAAAPWTPDRWNWLAPRGITLAADAPAALVAASASGTASGGATGTLVQGTAIDVTGQGLAQGFAAHSTSLSLALPTHAPATHRDAAFTASLAFSGVSLPQPLPGLGSQIDSLSLTATVRGRLPPGLASTALAAWRDDGGTVEIAGAHLRWGTVDLTLSGTLALDRRLQPMGALTATVRNPAETIDAAVAAGFFEPRFAAVAKTILGALAKTGADGTPAVTVPLALQNNELFLGPAPVAVLPPLRWP